MKVIVSNIIQIENPSENIIKWAKTNLTFKNPEYSQKVKLGLWTGGTPKYLTLYNIVDNNLYLPVGCYEDLVNTFGMKEPALNYDLRSEVNVNIDTSMKLRDYQVPAITPFVSRFHSHTNGLIIMPCGLGKTNVALYIAYKLHQKTLFITHTLDLVNQAHTRCLSNLHCKTSLITEGKVDLSGDIVFATVQTLVKNLDKISPDTFGLLVVDEIHRMTANTTSVGMFRECVEYFSATYKVGLTATLHRSDGLESCIPKIIGNVLYEIKDEDKDYVGYLDGREVIRFDKSEFQVPAKVNFIKTNFSLSTTDHYGIVHYKDVFDKSGMTISFAKLMNEICSDEDRNKLIIDCVNNSKGSSLILSDRVSQLEYLQKYIPNSVVITGTTKKSVRQQALKDVEEGRVRCLIASYKIAKEGLDLPILENLFLASPIKDDAIVVQSIGRIQRICGDKSIANVYDFVDSEVSTLQRFYYKRKNIYKMKGWL